MSNRNPDGYAILWSLEAPDIVDTDFVKSPPLSFESTLESIFSLWSVSLCGSFPIVELTVMVIGMVAGGRSVDDAILETGAAICASVPNGIEETATAVLISCG